jgi:hypothetical protein
MSRVMNKCVDSGDGCSPLMYKFSICPPDRAKGYQDQVKLESNQGLGWYGEKYCDCVKL